MLEKDLCFITSKTKKNIVKLIESGVIFFGCGGARGFDTLAAEIVLELKSLYPQIKLILVLPCTNQTKGWNDIDKKKYEHIKRKADKIRILSPYYYKGCMHVRNRYMIDNSSYCVCYCRKTDSGTAYTVRYAKKLNKIIIYI